MVQKYESFEDLKNSELANKVAEDTAAYNKDEIEDFFKELRKYKKVKS